MTKTYCASEEAYRRQWKIAWCLIQQMEQRPYRQITVSSLCQDVGISRMAFYRHFENKEACLAFILEQMVMDTCIPALSSGSAADLYPDILRCIQSWRHWADMMQLLTDNGLRDLLLHQTCLHLLREENHLLCPIPAAKRSFCSVSAASRRCSCSGTTRAIPARMKKWQVFCHELRRAFLDKTVKNPGAAENDLLFSPLCDTVCKRYRDN